MGQPPYDPYGGYQPQDPYAKQQQHHHYYGSMPMAPPTNGMATTSMVCGIVGILLCGIASPFAVIFGHVALGQIKRTGEGGHGMAVAGLILGYIVTVIWVLILLFYVGLIAAFVGAENSSSNY
ncbi:DUF4190 domain-containing protein [Spirillospora sp. CA-294931]|uniref:DUF4190 domain-containing protein n=1 Tax=Spirillospora sp. CA-294931 TaxID=3240042 RepID=UPI003D94CB83